MMRELFEKQLTASGLKAFNNTFESKEDVIEKGFSPAIKLGKAVGRAAPNYPSIHDKEAMIKIVSMKFQLAVDLGLIEGVIKNSLVYWTIGRNAFLEIHIVTKNNMTLAQYNAEYYANWVNAWENYKATKNETER